MKSTCIVATNLGRYYLIYTHGLIYHISLHHKTLRMFSFSNQILQWFQVRLHHPHWPCVYRSTHFNLPNLVYEVVFLCIEKCWRQILSHFTHYLRNFSLPILYIILMDFFQWKPSTDHDVRKYHVSTKQNILHYN